MNKVLSALKTSLPTVLITILTIRAAVLGASIGDAIAIIALAGLYGYKLFLDTKLIVNINDDVLKEVEKIKSEVGNVAIAISQRPQSKPTQFRF